MTIDYDSLPQVPELAMVSDEPTTACCALLPSLRLSSDEAEQLAAMFKALGHPVRLQIVDLLSRFGGQVCVCDVEGQFDLSQPTISHHFKILREAGLVDAEQRGLWVYYFLKPSGVAILNVAIQNFATQTAR